MVARGRVELLAGMMAAELGLDEKLARRATLMHDNRQGADAQEDRGSHAVIRRGHRPPAVAAAELATAKRDRSRTHADEPCNSVYAVPGRRHPTR